MNNFQEMITAREAARRLNINRKKIADLINSGSLPAQRVGRDWIIDSLELMNFSELPKTKPHLTIQQNLEIISKFKKGQTIIDLAKEFAVTDRTIYRVIKKS